MLQSASPSRKVGLLLGLGIFIVPYFAVWALLRDGYSTRARVIGFGWTAFIAFYIISLSNTPISTTKNSSPKAEATQTGEKRWPQASYTAFNLLQPHTATYPFIAGLFGPGELEVSSDTAGIKTESYIWKYSDGSMMSLMFQNDRLVMKSQSGLH